MEDADGVGVGGPGFPTAEHDDAGSVLDETFLLSPGDAEMEALLHVVGPVLTVGSFLVDQRMYSTIQVALKKKAEGRKEYFEPELDTLQRIILNTSLCMGFV